MFQQRRQAKTGWIFGLGAALVALVFSPTLLCGNGPRNAGSQDASISSQVAVAANLHIAASAETESSDGLEPTAGLSGHLLPQAVGLVPSAIADRTPLASFGLFAIPLLRGPPSC